MCFDMCCLVIFPSYTSVSEMQCMKLIKRVQWVSEKQNLILISRTEFILHRRATMIGGGGSNTGFKLPTSLTP